MLKALRLARLCKRKENNFKRKENNCIFHACVKKYGGFELLIHSYYDPNLLEIPNFYKELFRFFHEILLSSKALFGITEIL